MLKRTILFIAKAVVYGLTCLPPLILFESIYLRFTTGMVLAAIFLVNTVVIYSLFKEKPFYKIARILFILLDLLALVASAIMAASFFSMQQSPGIYDENSNLLMGGLFLALALLFLTFSIADLFLIRSEKKKEKFNV